jgi:nucleotide-binding universal stress UspA family protein
MARCLQFVEHRTRQTITTEPVKWLALDEEAMNKTSKPYLILVGIDYSTASELALQRALELAVVHPNAELHVVHVLPTFETPPSADAAGDEKMDTISIDPAAYQQLQTYVAVSLAAFEKQRQGVPCKPVKVVSHLRVHAPAHEIAQLASDLEADLVIVGMYGRSNITRILLGSVAESVTRLAPCPVLVFRPKGIPPEYPKIQPPCPVCVETRVSSGGKEYWCGQHRERHGQRHVYRHNNGMAEGMSSPLFVQP